MGRRIHHRNKEQLHQKYFISEHCKSLSCADAQDAGRSGRCALVSSMSFANSMTHGGGSPILPFKINLNVIRFYKVQAPAVFLLFYKSKEHQDEYDIPCILYNFRKEDDHSFQQEAVPVFESRQSL